MEGRVISERFEPSGSLSRRLANCGRLYEGLERPLPFRGKPGRSQQLRETGEHHELHVDETAPSDVAAQVEPRVRRRHDDRDGLEAVIRLVLGQQAFEALLGLLDALDVQRGFRHELWLLALRGLPCKYTICIAVAGELAAFEAAYRTEILVT